MTTPNLRTRTSVFASYEDTVYEHNYVGTLYVESLVGGIPDNPKVAEAWVRSKVAAPDAIIQQAVAETMLTRGVTADDAAEEVAEKVTLNGFKRTADGQLYIEGRQLKAALKEAASVALNAGNFDARGWGQTNKSFLGWFPEHFFIPETALPLEDEDGNPIKEPSEIRESFVHTWRGSGISRTEVVHDCYVNFRVTSDLGLSEKEWARLWVTGQHQGIGADRSQGFGTYAVVRWEKVTGRTVRSHVKREAKPKTPAPAEG